MLKKVLVVVLICAAELLVLSVLRPQPESGSDAVALNALVRSIELAEGDYSAADADGYAFTVLSRQGAVLYKSQTDMPEEPLSAAAAGCIVLPFRAGTLIAEQQGSPGDALPQLYYALAAAAVFLSAVVMLVYTFWLERRIVKPFRNIRSTAEAIAAGHLDIPLSMDRGGVFGPFTESFDLMRSELERAQAAEAKAAADKRDLIAKLSHDLRTPIASIQAVSELGALTAGDADRRRFEQIAGKTMQLNVLVSNLLNASLEEQTDYTVTVRPVSSAEIRGLLEGADYRRWLRLAPLPDCSVEADPVRLQQIFDNIFSNAYKYGQSPVLTAGFIQGGELMLEFEDTGGGVGLDEAASLHLRYFRGRNAGDAQGAGLGLYICDQLLRAMRGELLIRNGGLGLQVSVIVPLAHGSVLRES